MSDAAVSYPEAEQQIKIREERSDQYTLRHAIR